MTLTGPLGPSIFRVMGPDNPSDAELLDRIGHQDRQALRLLYRRHSGLLLGLVSRIVHEGATAEEVVQDVFLRVWSKASSYQSDRASVLTWMVRIARNRALDALRKGARAQPHPWELLGPENRDPESSLEFAGDQEAVRQAVATLSPEQRRALSLAFYEGQTHLQIAAALGEPLGTIKSRIRDGLRKLRDSLSPRREP